MEAYYCLSSLLITSPFSDLVWFPEKGGGDELGRRDGPQRAENGPGVTEQVYRAVVRAGVSQSHKFSVFSFRVLLL